MAVAAVSPTPGSVVEVYYGSGAGVSYSNEAMEEVNLTPRYERYTVYRITAVAKRIMTDAAVPVFQWQDGGAGEFATLTAAEVWYGAGYIVLAAALDGTDVVRCLSGNYVAPVRIYACSKREFEKTLGEVEFTVYSDTARQRYPTIKDWNAVLDVVYAGVQATEVSIGGLANSHIRCYHILGGTVGNGATFDFQDTDQAALTVTVVADDVVVDLATVATNPVSTAKEVVAALNADADVIALNLAFKIKEGETGAAVVADSGPYTLAGGVAPLDFEDLEEVLVAFRFLEDLTNDAIDCGFGFITSLKYHGGPADLNVATMTVVGAEWPMFRTLG